MEIRLPERSYALDAFRGLTMVWMVSEGFGLLHFRTHSFLGPIAEQFTHTDWEGMTAWDLIQPFFMFIVGVAMPFSFGKRWAGGEKWTRSLRHVLQRFALLILWGLIARSIRPEKPTLDLINVLAQIAFTYLVAFLILRWPWKAQLGVAFGLLAAHWALHMFWAPPGVTGPWVKDANVGWYLDRTILGKNWGGSYATINCISSAANTIFGMMAGQLLLDEASWPRKLRILALTGLGGIAAGLALSPVIPIIKKIWTASFALYSTGYTLLALVAFLWICDIKLWRGWAKIFVIAGSNSIFIYLFHEIMEKWLSRVAPVFTGWAIQWWGDWGRFLTDNVVIAFQIYVCWWLWRRKIFFKL